MNIMYDPVCDWYVRYEIYEIDGARRVKKYTMEYYYGQSNIPKVKRKKWKQVGRKIVEMKND